MKNHLFRILAYLIVLTFLFQPIQTLAYADQVEISDNSSMAAAQTPMPSEPYSEQFEKEFEMEIEAERQRILEEHLREEGLPEELLTHEYGSNLQEKQEYVPPSAEVIAQTKAQVDSFSCANITDVPVSECEALVALYASTNGAGWNRNNNWLATNTVGNWYGVEVDSENVVLLDLGYNHLKGFIPSELSNLIHLKSLIFASNVLSGIIPNELGNLYDLQELILYSNELNGEIPSELCNLINLQTISLNFNYYINGNIPTCLNNLKKLTILNLDSNQLGGNIPVELGDLSNLQSLQLGFNQLNGNIPSELGRLNNLISLSLSNNQLSGNIPVELGDLSNLQYLSLEVNQLTGTIPQEIVNLVNLLELDLSGNQLSGTIPMEIGNLSNLYNIFLDSNNLNGSIPPSIGNLSNLQKLDFSFNQFTSEIPSELGKLSNLQWLFLNNNQLNGSIPSELGDLCKLEYLELGDNHLNGKIPSELGKLNILRRLKLWDNQLNGTIPPELGNLRYLQTLGLSDNQLNGTIPPELGNLRYLQTLGLSDNQLNGTIPPELGNLTSLLNFNLTSNQLSGSIPLSFINLSSLYDFRFNGNSLCEPNTPEFLAWKATVTYWVGTGIVCDGLPIITNIEINQALGVQKDNEQNFVANKPAVIRLQLDQKVPVDRHTQKLEVVRDGSSIQTLYPNYNSSQSKILEFYCPMVSTVCGNWPPGEYTFKAYVGSNSLTKTADFVTTKTLRILVHPVKVVDGLNIIKLTNDEWKTSYRFLKNTYPISSNSIEWVIGSELTMLGKDISIFTSMLNFLSSWSFGYDRVLAIIPPIADCTENGCYLGGSTSKASACLANGSFYNEFDDTWWNIDYLEQCVTHEIGHTLGLGDEYDNSEATYFCNVNPPPSDYYDCGGVDQPSAWNGDGTGSLIPASAHPYEVNGRGLLPNSLSFMGNGEPQNSYWISQDIYSHIFNKLTTSPSSQSAQPMEVKRVALANGWISREESVSFDPWYSFESTFTQSTVGDYSIEAVSADESVLATQNFDISFTDFSNPPIFHERAPFSLLVPFPIGTIRFDIRHSGIKIGSLEVNPGIPSVNITSPSSGDSWSTGSEQTIRWDGIADGSIYYTVFYTADGVNFQILGSDLIGNSLVVNTEFLPGSQTSQIKILATDGINTTEDFSDGFFQVEGKSPLAKVYNPLNNEQIPYGISALLDGTGYDLEDGIISGDNISWSSDKDGFLGTGPNILVDLSYGCHTLTIKITDSDGYSSQDSINIFVGSKIFIPLILR